MWIFSWKGPSGFSACSTAEEVTQGIDGTGLTAIVTGASSGLGLETTRVLALRGVHVIMAVRNMEAGGKVKQEIVDEIPTAKIDVMKLDLSSMESVRKFASEYNASALPLNILINNAGVLNAPFMLSHDNIELKFATNHLGASSGLGLETTRVLALRGVHVIMAVRNMEAGGKVKQEIVDEIPTAQIDVMKLDLSSMESVRKFASEYNASALPLNILINNAGVLNAPFMLSHDNIELKFATNHLGHFLLTNLLLETMEKTARESNKEGRIVIVPSDAHRFTYREGIRFDKINDESGYKYFSAYGESKLANILHANELSRRFKEEGVEITANSLHPGAIVTNMTRAQNFVQAIALKLANYVLKNVQQGAATQCYLALHPQVKGVSGEYFKDSNISNAGSQAKDAELPKKLWDFSLSLTNQN